MEYFLD